MTGFRIIDTFLFDAELSLLAHRLAETADLVDLFVVVEAGETFRGERKAMTFHDHRKLFSGYEHKIRHIALPKLGNSSTDPWNRERTQREAIHFALHDARPDDIILILDADEIPSRSLLQRLRREALDQPRRLLMTRHYEAADLLAPASPCCPDVAEPFSFAHGHRLPGSWTMLDIDWFSRSGVAAPYRALSESENSGLKRSIHAIRRSTALAGALPDAGRHLCFVDPSAHPSRKLGRSAHAELSGTRSQANLHLLRCRKNGLHHHGWWYAERPSGPLPADLQRLIERTPEIEHGRQLPMMAVRRAVRSWTWLRTLKSAPDNTITRAVDNRLERLLPLLLPVLITVDLLRAIAARLARRRTNHYSANHHVAG